MSLKSPNKAEKDWMRRVAEFGCIVCYVHHDGARTPCDVHHLIDEGGRRISHLHTIGLCSPGHHKYAMPGSGKIPRHPWKHRFEEAYGTEEELLEKTKKLLELDHCY